LIALIFAVKHKFDKRTTVTAHSYRGHQGRSTPALEGR